MNATRTVYAVEVSIIDTWRDFHDPRNEDGAQLVRVSAESEEAACLAALSHVADDLAPRFKVGDATICFDDEPDAPADIEADEEEESSL